MSVLDGDILYSQAACSTVKQLDAVYRCVLHFITGDRYCTHHCILR